MYKKNRQELIELAKNLLEREEESELPVISQVMDFSFELTLMIMRIDDNRDLTPFLFLIADDITFII